jgi:branched-chain amino acid transport system permease protein
MKRTQLLYIGLLLLALVAPFVVYPIFLMKCLSFALFACAFNLLIGFTGLLSFGHAMFFGFAAYLCGHAAKVWGLSPELAILFGTISAAAIGFLVGWLAVRRQGIYFAMITLALSQMIYFICVQAPFTFAEDGIQSIPRGKLFGMFSLQNDFAMYYFVLAVFLFGFLLIYRTIHSPFGQVLKSIRENEPRAISLGYDVDKYKLVRDFCRFSWHGWGDQIAFIGFGYSHRCQLADVRRSCVDDTSRRHGHDSWACAGSYCNCGDAKLPIAVWLLGNHYYGHHVCGLRTFVPARNCWRNRAPVEKVKK